MSDFMTSTNSLYPSRINPDWETVDSKLCNENTGPVLKQIKEQNVISIIKKFIINNWPNIKNPDNFPGPQPVSLERKDLVKLHKYNYYVCEKTDGMRYLLVSKMIDGFPTTFLVNRAFNVYFVSGLWSCVSIYDGTILDGEVVKEEGGTYTYFPHDCVMRAGISYSQENFTKRNMHSREISVLWRKSDPEQQIIGILEVKFKTFYNFKDINTLIVNNSLLKHDVDGIIFTPVGLPIQTGTQFSLIKWKEPTKHTFDFQIEIKGQRIDYLLYEKMSLIKFKTVSKRSPAGKKILKILNELIVEDKMINMNLDSSNKVNDTNIVECYLEDDNYIPLKLRNDKTRPNSLRTLEKTIVNIEENITKEELVVLAQQVNVNKKI